MAFDQKKFLDKAGVSHLWGKIVTKIADDVKVEKDRAELAESGLSERIAKFEGIGEGSVAEAKAAADAAQKDVDAVEEDLGNVDNLSTTNKTVVGAINEVLTAVGTGGTNAVVTIDTATTTDGALKSYTIKQGGTAVGTIDIPKDMVVESGSVVTNPEGQAEGTYIKLVLANVAEPLYINVGTLVDIYTAKADAPQVQITIDSSTREISATIVAGSVTATELAANAVTTEKIADANVTKAKLSSEVQGLLDNAATEADLTLAENRITTLEGKFGEGAGTVESQIATAKQEAIDAASTDATSKANAAQAAAEATAAADATAKANKALEDAKADATSKADTAESNAKAYADSLAGNYDAKGEAQAAYDAIVALSNEEIDAACVITQA